MNDEKDATVQIEKKDESNLGSGVQSPERSEKLAYKKPQLKKYTQIDYVSAYGVDD